MKTTISELNEKHAAAAFTKQAAVFDGMYASNTIIQYKRKRVREHLENLIPPASYILELNAGTGDDAIFFAVRGHHVHGTDISQGMLEMFQKKVLTHGLNDRISEELCSYTQLNSLQDKGPYDVIFSNFAGLNCTDQLESVFDSFDSLLKPGGIVTLVMLPKFCLWESLLSLKGEFKTAFRRFFSRHGRKARVEGEYFKCWYYNPSEVIEKLKPKFELLNLEGLCTLVPPSYIEGFAEKHPSLYRYLERKEEQLKSSWPWKNIGDYYIISLRKKYN